MSDKDEYQLLDENGDPVTEFDINELDKGDGIPEGDDEPVKVPAPGEDPMKVGLEDEPELEEEPVEDEPDPRDARLEAMERKMAEMTRAFQRDKFETEMRAEVSKLEADKEKILEEAQSLAGKRRQAERVPMDHEKYEAAQKFLQDTERDYWEMNGKIALAEQKVQEARGKKFTDDSGDVYGEVPQAANDFMNKFDGELKSNEGFAKSAAAIEGALLAQGMKPTKELYDQVEATLKAMPAFASIDFEKSNLTKSSQSYIMGNTGKGNSSNKPTGQPTARRGTQEGSSKTQTISADQKKLLDGAAMKLGSDIIDKDLVAEFVKDTSKVGKRRGK